MNNGLEIKTYEGTGYDPTLPFKTWLVAFINFEERFDNITFIERHLETDEVFVLLAGSAELWIGEEREVVPMEPCKLYNVKAGTWHNIKVSRDAKVLVIENSDTVRENSEYRDI